jgi:3-deoxy-D-manno-octulosonic-acid transferase
LQTKDGEQSFAGPAEGGAIALWSLVRERLLPDPRTPQADIWLQAVSVGEVEIAATLVAALREKNPDLALLVTATTPAGVSLLPVRFGATPGVSCRPFPLDFGFSVRRFFDAVRPGILVLVETELWPIALAEAGRRGVPVAVVNGRLSEKSGRRLRLAGPLFRSALGAVSRVAARTPEDAARFVEAGIAAERVFVAGDLKLDRAEAPEPAFAARVRAVASGRPVVVAGSLAEEEIPAALAARRFLASQGIPTLFLVAPRQPSSFDAAASRCSAAGFAVVRRSEPEIAGERADVFLLDTIGELASAYRCGAAAILGGTFVEKGGHNVLEPLRAGLPVVHGRSTGNIRALLESAGAAAFPARDGEDAGRTLAGLLRDDAALRRAADAAASLFSHSAGAMAGVVEMILALRRRPA